MIRVAFAQLNLTVGDLPGNVTRLIAAAEQAASDGAAMLITPELAVSGYPPEDLVGRDDFLADCRAALDRLAAATAHLPVTLIVGVPLRTNGRVTADATMRQTLNALAVVRDGEVTATYGKQLLPNYGPFDEARHFTRGDDKTVIVNVDGVRVGLAICEDIWADHGPLSALADAGADLVAVANASPWHDGKPAEREAVLTRAAVRHNLPLAWVNLVGGQDELVFDGRSMLVTADGHIPVRAPAWEDVVVTIDVDPVGADKEQQAATDDRLADLWSALTVGVRDYVRKNGFTDVVVGISGGIDSAVVTTLAADALGADRVLAVSLPSAVSSEHSVTDATELARRLGVNHRTIPIAGVVHTVNTTLSDTWKAFGVDPDKVGTDVTEENIQARTRGLLLMAISNKTGRLLLSCGNKDESAVGYATLYGDMSGGLSPIGDVSKTHVWALARWRNTNPPAGTAADVIPQTVISKPPSAELAPGQVDADTLPSYDKLGRLVHALVVDEVDLHAAATSANLNLDEAEQVAARLFAAEHKRRQAPPTVKTSARTFGRDRRYPITSAWHPHGESNHG